MPVLADAAAAEVAQATRQSNQMLLRAVLNRRNRLQGTDEAMKAQRAMKEYAATHDTPMQWIGAEMGKRDAERLLGLLKDRGIESFASGGHVAVDASRLKEAVACAREAGIRLEDRLRRKLVTIDFGDLEQAKDFVAALRDPEASLSPSAKEAFAQTTGDGDLSDTLALVDASLVEHGGDAFPSVTLAMPEQDEASVFALVDAYKLDRGATMPRRETSYMDALEEMPGAEQEAALDAELAERVPKWYDDPASEAQLWTLHVLGADERPATKAEASFLISTLKGQTPDEKLRAHVEKFAGVKEVQAGDRTVTAFAADERDKAASASHTQQERTVNDDDVEAGMERAAHNPGGIDDTPGIQGDGGTSAAGDEEDEETITPRYVTIAEQKEIAAYSSKVANRTLDPQELIQNPQSR